MAIILDGTLGETFPSWTTAGRPASPVVGQMGYNTTTGLFDMYTASGWVSSLTNASQSIPKSALPTGSVLQVVQGVDTTSRSTNTNWPVASGFGTSITPTSATSKILVTMNIQFYLNSGSNTNKIGILGIYRGSTYLMGQRSSVNANYAAMDAFLPATLVYLDSPATTSSTTYNFYWGRYDTANFPNTLNMGDGMPAVGGTQPSTITLLEIAA